MWQSLRFHRSAITSLPDLLVSAVVQREAKPGAEEAEGQSQQSVYNCPVYANRVRRTHSEHCSELHFRKWSSDLLRHITTHWEHHQRDKNAWHLWPPNPSGPIKATAEPNQRQTKLGQKWPICGHIITKPGAIANVFERIKTTENSLVLTDR